MTFAWARTRPDLRYDFVAADAGAHVGRIMRISTGGVGPSRDAWIWTCTGAQRPEHELRPLFGEAPTRDEAIEALAACWARAKAWSAQTGSPLA